MAERQLRQVYTSTAGSSELPSVPQHRVESRCRAIGRSAELACGLAIREDPKMDLEREHGELTSPHTYAIGVPSRTHHLPTYCHVIIQP